MIQDLTPILVGSRRPASASDAAVRLGALRRTEATPSASTLSRPVIERAG